MVWYKYCKEIPYNGTEKGGVFMGSDHLLYEKEGHLARIILNRPEALNAFSLSMIKEWAKALQDAQSDPNIRAVVVTARG